MQYNFDYFISYAHADNHSEDGKSGFVDEFVEKLQNDSTEHKNMFGGEIKVFFDKSEIEGMADWDNRIRSSLASSRFLIVLLSPNYFKSEYCAREFEWWMQHEMHRRVLGEGTAPILIVDVTDMYNDKVETIPDIPKELQARFPNWRNQICAYQNFDLHNLDRAKIDDILNSLREGVKDRVMHQEAAEQSPCTGHYPRYNENFVGRRENLRSLRKSLNEKTVACYSALTGLGGFGKTELALTYGHAFAWDYLLGRVFANCENKTSLTDILLTSGIAEMHGWKLPEGSEEQQITDLFKKLKDKFAEIVKSNENKKKLNTLGAHILLILDNVNNCKLVSRRNLAILPDFFHVIITTRENSNDLSHLDKASIQSVEELSEDESVELLGNIHPFANSEEAEAGRKIAKLLSGFTLIVELTGAYLHKCKHITYQKQYNQLVLNHADVFKKMADKTGDLTLHAAETVSVVLESTLSAISPNTRKALNFASMMAPDAVALSWLPELCGLNDDEAIDVRNELTGYSLLAPLENEQNIARIHHLVAETVKQQIIKEKPEAVQEIIAKIRQKCEALLKTDETFWCTSGNAWNITPVSEFCLELAKQWTVATTEGEIDWEFTRMLVKSGNILCSLGKITKAREVFQRNCDIHEKIVKMYPSNFDALRNLSISYSKCSDVDHVSGKNKLAKDLLKQAITIHKSIAEQYPNHIEIQYDLIDLYGYLGYIERFQGNFEESRANFLEAFKIYNEYKNFSSDISVQRNWSALFVHCGELENAEGNTVGSREWYKMALDFYSTNSEKTPDTIQNQLVLSSIYSFNGDMEMGSGNFADARKCYEKAFEIAEQLNDKIPDSFQNQQNLCIMYRRLGDLEKESENLTAAQEWYEKFHISAKQLNEKAPENVQNRILLGLSFNRLSIMYEAAGNTFAARESNEKSVIIAQRLVDQMPENVVFQIYLCNTYINMGVWENDAGNITSAREWYEKALDIHIRFAKMIPENFEGQLSLSMLYDRLAIMEKDAGNISSACEWYKKAIEIYQQLADKKPDKVDIQQALFASYVKIGELEKDAGNIASALVRYEKGAEICKRVMEMKPENADTTISLAYLYFQLSAMEKEAGNITAAREWFEKEIEIAKRIIEMKPDDFDIENFINSMYSQLFDLDNAAGNSTASQEWYEKISEILQSLPDYLPD